MSKQKTIKHNPKGIYVGTITDNRLRTPVDEKTGEEKTPYFEIDFTVTHYVMPDTGKEVAVERSFSRSAKMYISQDTLEFLPDQLAACGYHGDLAGLETVSLINNRVKLLNRPEPSKSGDKVGQIYDRFSPLYSKARAPKPPSTSGAGKRLQMLFGSSYKPVTGTDQPQNQKPAQSTPDASKRESDTSVPVADELPF